MVRLIDADELIQVLCVNMDTGKQFYRATHCVDEMPTVDAVPVKHGRWIKGSETKMIKKNRYLILADAMYCSECENEAYWDTDYGQQLFDYCPNCGARMDAE